VREAQIYLGKSQKKLWKKLSIVCFDTLNSGKTGWRPQERQQSLSERLPRAQLQGLWSPIAVEIFRPWRRVRCRSISRAVIFVVRKWGCWLTMSLAIQSSRRPKFRWTFASSPSQSLAAD